MSAPDTRLQTSRGYKQGFTLLELIISLSLLGTVLALIYGTLYQLSSGANHLRDGLNERQELRLLLKMISDDLQGVRWLGNYLAAHPAATSGIYATLHKEGNEEFSEIAMHISQPSRFYRSLEREKDPGLHEVGWLVRPDKEGTPALFRREDFYLDDNLQSGGVEVPVAEGIQVFRVEFLPVPDAPTNSEEWTDRWNSGERAVGKRLPNAVRVTLGRKLPNGEELKEIMEFNQYIRD